MITVVEQKAHVSDEKKQIVSEFTKLIDQYPVIAAVDVEKLPAKQLMTMRKKLKGKALVRMNKKRLMNIALQNSKREGVTELSNYLKGMSALLFSNSNPFSLFKELKKNKSPAPIKAGEIAPQEIVVPAGPTNFAPGPIIGELGSIGVKAGIEDGKVAIKEDSVVAKEGDEVSAKLAGLLQRLEINPVEIGLNLVAAYENGSILTKDVLDIDEQEYIDNVKLAASEAFLLSVERAIPTKDNVTTLITKAHSEASVLADDQEILTDENKERLFAKAESQAKVLESKVNESK